MSSENKARILMMRHHYNIKNRQQSILNRTASEIGLDLQGSDYWSNIQGKPYSGFSQSYDRSHASLS